MSMLLTVVLIKASLAVTCYKCGCRARPDCDCRDPFNPSDTAETCNGDICHAQKMEIGQFTYTNYTFTFNTFNTFIFLKKMFISLTK